MEEEVSIYLEFREKEEAPYDRECRYRAEYPADTNPHRWKEIRCDKGNQECR